jgi:lipid II:glycine glycyltransferase (peptidoglycan interpeptide bridge formation enzyme)
VLHTLPLNDAFYIIDKRIHSMHRRNAKIALNRGVHIEIGKKPEHLKAFYHLHMETRRKQGIPVQPWKFFDLLGKILLDEDLGFVFLAYQQEKIIAGMVLLAWGQILTYKYGASCSDSLNLRPNDLLFWTAIQWASEHGYKVFDFGRTDINNEGLRTFKSRWGAEETPLSYSILSEKLPQPSSGRMMSLMKMIIRNSPLWVCRITGELLYKHFG